MMKVRRASAILLYWMGTYLFYYFAHWSKETGWGGDLYKWAYAVAAMLVIGFWAWAIDALAAISKE